jgi:DeoR/GlpR family transcriptional regulator of sugar metabolism
MTQARDARIAAMFTLMRAIGPMTTALIRDKLARAGHPVTIDTVQRDVAKLVEEYKLRRVYMGDGYEAGSGSWMKVWRYNLPEDAL